MRDLRESHKGLHKDRQGYLIDFATVSNSGNVNLSGLPIESIDYTVVFSNS